MKELKGHTKIVWPFLYIRTMKILIISALTLLFTYQSSPANSSIDFEIEGPAKSKKYGYTEKDPIKVGGGVSAGYHFMFLQHLRGKNGERLQVERLGSCCDYKNADADIGLNGSGVLTTFKIYYPGMPEPKILYFDKYRKGKLYIPHWLTWEK